MKAKKTLAIKYRPTTFEDVVEQGSIRLILQEQLKTKTHKNCYLFTGGAGTGKTTCARIFANEVNEGKGTPIEIDAASNNGVDNVREIIGDAKFKALDSVYKVYIIDECHMLSNGAWNAMLKLIEEPPAQTMFIFCTTDPQKIPATILSRVQRYDFHRISFSSILDRLEAIVKMENTGAKKDGQIKADKEALSYIAKIADGGMRDAITLLDKCISYDKNITTANVVKALGIIGYDLMMGITEELLLGYPANALKILNDGYRSGIDLKQFVKQYMNFLIDCCKYSLMNSFEYLMIPSIYEEKMAKWEEKDFAKIRYYMEEMLELNSAIKWEANPKPLIEATIILLGGQ